MSRRGRELALPLALVLCGALLLFSIAGARRGAGLEARCDVRALARDAEAIDVRGCGLTQLPAEIGQFTRLRRLDASNNLIAALPPQLPPSLAVLFLTGNRFADLPSLSALPRLRMLSLRNNRLRGTLRARALPSHLAWLILTDNHIEHLPEDLGSPLAPDGRPAECALVKVMLANNALRALPASMAACERIELLRLANNRLEALPPWLLRLPRLAWIALASNPAMPRAHAAEGVPSLTLADLDVDRAAGALGEGTSGVVYRGRLTGTGELIAVKLYKTQLTSDGTTADEARASAAVGESAAIARTHALVVERRAGGAEDTMAGIALEWLPGFRSLGDPPSLDTISRDTYRPDVRFTLASAKRIAASICAAGTHLHAAGRQLMHGDVYAHNILVDDAGAAKLADFGAGFSYAGVPGADAFERIEVRAFAILLAELAERIDPAPGEAAEVTRLRKLASRVADAPPERRPQFVGVCAEL